MVQKVNTPTNIWYPPRNIKLEEFLFNNLPWKARGHKTHEFTMTKKCPENLDFEPLQHVEIIPFQERYMINTCKMLDKSLTHTFDDPSKGVFLINHNNFIKEWIEKALAGEFCIMIEKNSVVGAYILNGAEIDILAVAPDKQGRGFGKQLMCHAVRHIFSNSNELPFLYCMDINANALNFYIHEGMTVTGHSGYVFLEKISE